MVSNELACGAFMYTPYRGGGKVYFDVFFGFFVPFDILNVSSKPCFSFAFFTPSFIVFFFCIQLTSK